MKALIKRKQEKYNYSQIKQTSEPRKLPDRKGYYIKIKWPIHQKRHSNPKW